MASRFAKDCVNLASSIGLLIVSFLIKPTVDWISTGDWNIDEVYPTMMAFVTMGALIYGVVLGLRLRDFVMARNRGKR